MPPVIAAVAPVVGILAGAAAVATTVATIVAPKSGATKILGQVSAGLGIAGGFLGVAGGLLGMPPTIQFPGLKPGFVPSLVTQFGDLTPLLQALAIGVDFIGKGAEILQSDVGERLAALVGTHGGILDSIIKQFFPEMTGVKNNLGGILTTVLDGILPETSKLRGILEFIGFEQFPIAGLAIAQSNRARGVSERTLRLLKAGRMVPPSFTMNPNGNEDEDFGEELPREEEQRRFDEIGRALAGIPPPLPIVGLEGVSSEVYGPEVLAVVMGEGFAKTKDQLSGIGGSIARAAIGGLGLFAQAGIDLGKRAFPLVVDAGREIFGNIGQEMIDAVKDEIQSAGVTGPGEQGPVVEKTLTVAFTLGVGAHLVAAGAELLMPLKHLGLPQVAALMVDLAGFGTVARAELGAQIKAGIQRPAEFEANAIFQSNIPDALVLEIMAQKRDLPLEDFKQHLFWHGFPEKMIKVMMKGMWTEPKLFDIQRVVDDTFKDREWLKLKIQRAGYDDFDVELITDGLMNNATAGIRIGLSKEVQTAFARGLMNEEELESEMTAVDMSDPSKAIMRKVSGLQRRRELAEDWEKVVRGQAEDSIIGLEDYRNFLEGLGFSDSRIAVLVATVQAKVERKVTREERADIKKAVRDFQQSQIKIAQESFRRRQITQSELSRFLVQFGIEEVQASAMAILAGIRREPVPRVPAPVSLEVQRERENKIIQDTALLAFRKDQIPEVALASILASLQVPAREAEALVTREVARKTPPPSVITKEPPGVVQARRLRTQAAVTEFREEKINAEELRERLVEIGNPQEVAAAFVEREEARIPAPAPPGPPPPVPETAEEREIRQLRSTAAREIFRAGRLTASELLNLLVNLGNDPDISAAIVELEQVRLARGLPS